MMVVSSTLLTPAFFNRDPRKVARGLLGKLLVRKSRMGTLAGRIVETEAYLGAGDEAAHSFAGKTPRNSVLFGPPGFVYVYFIYGTHYCLNVSCLPDGVAGGVLFRALEPVTGIERMAKARGIKVRGTEDVSNPSWAPAIDIGPGPVVRSVWDYSGTRQWQEFHERALRPSARGRRISSAAGSGRPPHWNQEISRAAVPLRNPRESFCIRAEVVARWEPRSMISIRVEAREIVTTSRDAG